MSYNVGNSLLETLEGLLEEQISLSRRGDYSRVAGLCERCSMLIDRLSAVAEPVGTDFVHRRARLLALYKKLALMLSGERELLSGQLKQLVDGRKGVRAYVDNS